MTSPLRSICCSRTIRIRSMSWKKPIWNHVLQMLQQKPRHHKKISKRSVTAMGRKEGEQSEDVFDDEQDAEHLAVIEPVALTMPDRPVPARVYSPIVPYPVPAKKSPKDWEEMKCKKMLEELNVKLSLMDAIQMILSMCNLNAALTPQQGMIEEILADDPLEVALIRVESEQTTCNIDADGTTTPSSLLQHSGTLCLCDQKATSQSSMVY
ncbi:hypothetical protein F2Q69_00035129 [Brassica cretica]|uniref:Uncharacterized protein n=1 Tax=Brassica cretica TaxID=69181 RepID=A0A8S9SPA1_BRACR|nr:hypothetical protein F2Q69_00035129 [Brassica cretica]